MSLLKNLFNFGIVEKGAEIIDEAFNTDQEKGQLKAVLLQLKASK